MASRSKLFVLFLLVASFALPVLANDVLLVIVDREHHRALVPEGSVIPAGMTIRVEAMPARGRTLEPSERHATQREHFSFMDKILKRPAGPPLVFEYAPVERFAQVRRQYEAQQARRQGTGRRTLVANANLTCYPIYATDSQTGYFGTYYNGFTSTFCSQTSGCGVGNNCEWGFGASGAYTDDDQWIYPYAAVYDQNNNFNCNHTAYGYESPVECSTTATTQLLQVGCLNTVHTVASLYVIEYLQNYDPYYLGFTFDVSYCTYFY